MLQFIQKYGPPIVAGTIILLILVFGAAMAGAGAFLLVFGNK